jgi:hypothetical protein
MSVLTKYRAFTKNLCSNVYRFIPHRRYLAEDFKTDLSEELSDDNENIDFKEKIRIQDGTEISKEIYDETNDSSSAITFEGNSNIGGDVFVSPTLAVVKIDDVEYEIREFRDEVNRPWWKFFDEFEYRETTEESKKYKWYKWFRDDASTAEKKLLCKLDILIAFYAFVGYWVKYIDSANLNNAYVSGMKEDVGFQGNDLVNVQVLFTVGSIVMEVFWVFAIPKIPVTYALCVSELFWSAFTLATYRVNTVSQIKGIRFMVGVSEAAYFPCIHYLFSNWYLPSEIGRRGGMFYIGQFLGVLTSGLLQSATFRNLSGVYGLEGWRWMFIVDGGLSFAVAILALLCVPGTPLNCYSLFLTDDDIRLARKRMLKAGNDLGDNTAALLDWKVWKKAFSTWHVYLLGFTNMLGFNANNTVSGSFVLWLKSLDQYSIGKVNDLSTIPPALGILYVIIVCGGADITRKRFLFIIISFLLNFIGNVILAKWDVSVSAKWFAFCFAYWSWSQSSVFNPMVNDFFRKDAKVKTVGWMVVYVTGLQSSAWVTKLVWPTVDSPRFEVGFSTCAAFSAGFSICMVAAYFLYKRDERREALENGIFIYNSENVESIPEFVKAAKFD